MKKLSLIFSLLAIASMVAGCAQATPAIIQTPSLQPALAPTATQTVTTIATQEPVATPTQGKTDQIDYEQKAREYLDLLVREDYAAAFEKHGPQMQAAFPKSKMEEVWKALIAQVGPFQKVTSATSQEKSGYQVVVLTSQFEKALLDVTIPIDPMGRVEGLFFAESKPSSATEEWTSPAYANSSSFQEKEVTVGSGEWALPGTLTLPKGNGPFPAVVLVHGSGPNDRDESVGPNKPFRDLAWGLASQGVAVLRYEKRTRQYAEKMADMIDQITVKEETIEDALLAVDLLRHTDGIDPQHIYVLGHSLGGMLFPRIGLLDPDIAGFLSMAGAARPLEDVVIDQVTYLANLDGTVSAEEKAQLEQVQKQVNQVKDPNLSKAILSTDLPLGIPAAYWLDLRGYQPAQAAKDLQRPILILQGGRDYQVTEADFNLWKKALDGLNGVEFKFFSALNHLFIEGEGKSTPAEYEKPGHVAEEVVNDIAKWILAQK